MDSVTVASAIATYVLPEAFKEGGKALGKGVCQTVSQLITVIQEKLKKAGAEGLINRVEKQPIEQRNLEILEAELVIQMNEDSDFANRLRELVKQLQSEGIIPTTPDNPIKYKFDFHKDVKGSAFGDNATATYKEK